MTEGMTGVGLVRLLHLAGPALPIGNFAYSQGMEFLHEEGLLGTEQECRDHLAGQLQGPMLYLDGPVFVRCYRAVVAGEPADFNLWNRRLLAARETYELQAEERNVGQSLHALLETLTGQAARPGFETDQTFTGSFAYAAACNNLGLDAALTAFFWAWLEARVAAAVKIIPLGQSAAQRILVQLGDLLGNLATRSQTIARADIGYGSPGAAHASAQHETQYTRLFLS